MLQKSISISGIERLIVSLTQLCHPFVFYAICILLLYYLISNCLDFIMSITDEYHEDETRIYRK